MSQPVDPTTTPAWARLSALYESLEPDLRGWFAADPSRAKSFTFTAGDLYVDLSKNLINADVLSALVDLADQVGWWSVAMPCSPGSTSTSPRTERCCTRRCGLPRDPA